jgi:hypothetical protein
MRRAHLRVCNLNPLVMMFVATGLGGQTQQDRPHDAICSAVAGVYPVTVRPFGLPLNQRPRFEIRWCGSGEFQEVQILGYSARERQPSLLVNTHAGWLDLLIQTGNVLIAEAGDSVTTSTLYIARFKSGKPELVTSDTTDGGVSYSEEHTEFGDFVIVTVPLKIYPDATGKFPDVPPRRYRIRTDEY